MELSYKKHILKFRFAAGTSRGFYKEKETWVITMSSNGLAGVGECGPLKGLSPEKPEKMEEKLQQVKEEIKQLALPKNEKEVAQMALHLAGFDYPSIRFGLESSLLDLLNGGEQRLFLNGFTNGGYGLPINGLIWMGDKEFMKKQVDEKPSQGYKCLKMKIGAISYNEELEIIRYIREKYPDIVLRLDANGALDPAHALERLHEMSKYNIHSIEQPIKPGQIGNMAGLCGNSPIPIALDEELIGVHTIEDKLNLLKNIQPQYIILKPTLLGGFAACSEWIAVADMLNIGWWVTSMLESNIGLNAIAQFTAEVKAQSFQGLGTGMLYENNIGEELVIDNGYIFKPK